MSKWNRKKIAGMLACGAAYAACVFWLCFQPCYVAMRGMLILSAATTLLAIYAAWKPLKIFILILASCLFVSQAQADTNDDGQLAGACIVAVAVIGVGLLLVISLTKMCKHCLPPPNDPPQPPASSTNHTASSYGNVTGTVSLPLSDEAVQCYDVSSYSFANRDPNGFPYLLWFTCVIESSTNLSNWRTQCTLNGWASATTIVTVWSDENAQPVCTNFVPRSASSITGQMPSLVADTDRKFFRVK